MKSKIFVFLFLLLIIVLTGCESVDENFSSKKLAERTLINELQNCESKFGTDTTAKREANIEYCYKVLDIVDDLYRNGFLEGDADVENALQNARNVTGEYKVTDDSAAAYDELDKTVSEIIGDI